MTIFCNFLTVSAMQRWAVRNTLYNFGGALKFLSLLILIALAAGSAASQSLFVPRGQSAFGAEVAYWTSEDYIGLAGVIGGSVKGFLDYGLGYRSATVKSPPGEPFYISPSSNVAITPSITVFPINPDSGRNGPVLFAGAGYDYEGSSKKGYVAQFGGGFRENISRLVSLVPFVTIALRSVTTDVTVAYGNGRSITNSSEVLDFSLPTVIRVADDNLLTFTPGLQSSDGNMQFSISLGFIVLPSGVY